MTTNNAGAALLTNVPTDPSNTEERTQLGESLRSLLADFFTLYLKTKNFHWHMRGTHFREYHLLLDEQAGELFNATDAVAERARKIGQTTLRSIGDITRYQRLKDTDLTDAPAATMLQVLYQDNILLTRYMRETHETCDLAGDLATASLLENWIDEAERRSWFLSATLDSGS